MRLVKVPPLLSSIGFFLVPQSALTSVPALVLGIPHMWALSGPKMDEKRAKMGTFTIKAIYDHLFNGMILEQG